VQTFGEQGSSEVHLWWNHTTQEVIGETLEAFSFDVRIDLGVPSCARYDVHLSVLDKTENFSEVSGAGSYHNPSDDFLILPLEITVVD
jgi:hypothetical protein